MKKFIFGLILLSISTNLLADINENYIISKYLLKKYSVELSKLDSSKIDVAELNVQKSKIEETINILEYLKNTELNDAQRDVIDAKSKELINTIETHIEFLNKLKGGN